MPASAQTPLAQPAGAFRYEQTGMRWQSKEQVADGDGEKGSHRFSGDAPLRDLLHILSPQVREPYRVAAAQGHTTKGTTEQGHIYIYVMTVMRVACPTQITTRSYQKQLLLNEPGRASWMERARNQARKHYRTYAVVRKI